MYTILINKDKTLTTTVKETLLRHSTTDQIQFLLTPDIKDDTTITHSYTAVLNYKGADRIVRSENLTTDESLYKDKVRFILPTGTAFFNFDGLLQVWIGITDTITTTTIDEDTGEETTATVTKTYDTLSTTVFICEVPHSRRRNPEEDNTIIITRGDSQEVDLYLTDREGYPYNPVEGDHVYFYMKKSAQAQELLIQKEIDIHTLVINFIEEDTRNLAFGEYRYEIEIVLQGGEHYTAIKNTPFIITEELH